MLRATIAGIAFGGTLAIFGLPFAFALPILRNFMFHSLALFTAGGFLLVDFRNKVELPLSVSLLFIMMIGAVGMLVVQRLIFEPAQRRGADRLTLFIVSFGLLSIVDAVAFIVWGTTTVPVRDDFATKGITLLDVRLSAVQLVGLLVGVAFVLGAGIFLRSVGGLRVRALIEGEEIAASYGANPRTARLVITLVLGASVALIGGLQALEAGAAPGRGFQEFLLVFIAAFAAGPHHPIAAGILAFVFGIARNVLPLWVPFAWVEPIFLAVLVAALLIRPPERTGLRARRFRLAGRAAEGGPA